MQKASSLLARFWELDKDVMGPKLGVKEAVERLAMELAENIEAGLVEAIRAARAIR
jgi:hypothetical protein